MLGRSSSGLHCGSRNSGGSITGHAISVSPQTGLPAVQQVNVSGTNFYTGYLPVASCTGVYPLLACSAPLVTFADVAGSFGPVQYTAQEEREFDAVNVVYHVNCVDTGSAPNGCFMVADQGVPGSPYWIYAVQPLTFASAAYPFTGFFQPVDKHGRAERRQGRPLGASEITLGGDRGLKILAAGYPQSRVIGCANQATDQVEETTSSTSGLSYDAAADQYIYVWTTDKSWAGQCRQLSVKLTDGTVHTGRFPDSPDPAFSLSQQSGEHPGSAPVGGGGSRRETRWVDVDTRRDVILTGIGGQGIQLCAKVLALAAAADDHHVMLSSYFGGEMRGGRTEATVVTRDGNRSSACRPSSPGSKPTAPHRAARGVSR